jgi:hypothetical protein
MSLKNHLVTHELCKSIGAGYRINGCTPGVVRFLLAFKLRETTYSNHKRHKEYEVGRWPSDETGPREYDMFYKSVHKYLFGVRYIIEAGWIQVPLKERRREV